MDFFQILHENLLTVMCRLLCHFYSIHFSSTHTQASLCVHFSSSGASCLMPLCNNIVNVPAQLVFSRQSCDWCDLVRWYPACHLNLQGPWQGDDVHCKYPRLL